MLRNSKNIKSSLILQHYKAKHTSGAVEKIRERLENGPSFHDFIQNPDHSREELSKEFDGKLRREKGDKERLRLPKWLKTPIPLGKYHQIRLKKSSKRKFLQDPVNEID